MQIYAIVDGKVLPYILDPNFEKYLPVIPSEVRYCHYSPVKLGGERKNKIASVFLRQNLDAVRTSIILFLTAAHS